MMKYKWIMEGDDRVVSNDITRICSYYPEYPDHCIRYDRAHIVKYKYSERYSQIVDGVYTVFQLSKFVGDFKTLKEAKKVSDAINLVLDSI